MRRILIVLTNRYPYDRGETYLESERPFWNQFDHVYICPLLVHKDHAVREGFFPMPYETVIPVEDFRPGFFQSLRNLFGTVSPADYWRELKELARTRRLNASNVRDLLIAGIKSNLRVRYLGEKLMSALGESAEESRDSYREKRRDGNAKDTKCAGGDQREEKRLLYSYRLHETALTGAGLRDRLGCSRLISRAHGYDLYEEVRETGYLPFREKVMDSLDHIYPVSEYGYQYLMGRYQGAYDQKISVARLGTIPGYGPFQGGPGKEPVLVSCSNLLPVKRVDLLVKALKQFRRPVTWIHFGDGPLRKKIEEEIRSLPGHVHARLAGCLSNDRIMKFYSDHYVDALINVSRSEGVPVSIMEAQSLGIPAIATDVGGTGELVTTGRNGVLLAGDFTAGDLVEAVENVIAQGQKYRDGARETWEAMSDARAIYRDFFDRELSAL